MVLLQVHSTVHAGDLIAVAIKHKRAVLEDFAEAALFGLAPARVIHIWIHVRVEAVFVGRGKVPGSWRHLLLEFDFEERLDALETVFPRNNHAHARASLVRQRFTVHTPPAELDRILGSGPALTLHATHAD